MDMDDSENTKQSETTIESEQIVESNKDPKAQTSVDPKSESQFNSFMSYHEGESSSLDLSTAEKELSKSPVNDSTQKNDSGADDHEDISSHDNDMIAYESIESGSSSIDISSANPVTDVEIVAEDTKSEPAIEVEVMEPRRSARDRKQTKFFGNPLLYRVNYHLTSRLIPELLQNLSDTMETLKERYSGTVEGLLEIENRLNFLEIHYCIE